MVKVTLTLPTCNKSLKKFAEATFYDYPRNKTIPKNNSLNTEIMTI